MKILYLTRHHFLKPQNKKTNNYRQKQKKNTKNILNELKYKYVEWIKYKVSFSFQQNYQDRKIVITDQKMNFFCLKKRLSICEKVKMNTFDSYFPSYVERIEFGYSSQNFISKKSSVFPSRLYCQQLPFRFPPRFLYRFIWSSTSDFFCWTSFFFLFKYILSFSLK